MFSLKKLLSRHASANLPADLQQALSAWQALLEALDAGHFHARYVVVDITTSGFKLDEDDLLGITALGVAQGGCVQPGDAIALDFTGPAMTDELLDRQLVAFLQFIGKAPLVTYHTPFVGPFLQRALKDRLGIDFQPACIDLAWLLPSMFEEKDHTLRPLDHWLELFGMESEGRRDAMTNTLLLARLFQRLLVRAKAKGIDSAGRLLEESRASSFLRRTH